MEQACCNKIIVFLVLSVLIFIGAVAYAIIKTFFVREKKKSSVGTLIVFSAFLVASIWSMRFAIGYYDFLYVKSEINASLFEKVFAAVFETLRTFGIEESYYELTEALRTICSGIIPAGKPYFNSVQNVLIFFATCINLAAPVAGGAIIFEILASIFPKFRMFFCYIAFWRKKYYFSELNEASLALAKGVLKMNKSFWKRPVIIFTDAYLDDEDEANSEIYMEAKFLGAICIKDDISHVRKTIFGSRAFLLIDENESANLRALTDLCDKPNAKSLKNSEIFFVSSSDAYLEIERQIQDKLIKEFNFRVPKEENKKTEKKCEKCKNCKKILTCKDRRERKKNEIDETPVFIPIKSYRNLISNLLVDIPLFEPLLGKNEKNELNVTILGTGYIGTEMFLTTYWIGQILDCKLKINIISDETENAFWNKIDYVNPEIRRTNNVNDPILEYNAHGGKSDPYCNVRYICCDAKSSAFVDCINDAVEDNLLNTDYFFVSLGNDDLNISVANTIKNAVGKAHITAKDGSKTVIAYVVYDPGISETLNRKSLYSFADQTADVLMHAVGNLEEVYSAENIFLMKYDSAAIKMHNAYLKSQGNYVENINSSGEKNDKKIRADIHKKRMKDDYKYWSNLSRSMHVKYKMFSMGIFYDSVFNFDSLDDATYKKSVNVAIDRYKRLVSGKVSFKTPAEEQSFIKLTHRLAWLEHRRWNAFTRVKGFRQTDDYDVYAKKGEIGSYKQMELKLHPCLVECDELGMRVDADGNRLTLTDSKPAGVNFDFLDDLSFDLYKKGFNDYDFKQYDYPIGDCN